MDLSTYLIVLLGPLGGWLYFFNGLSLYRFVKYYSEQSMEKEKNKSDGTQLL